MKTVLLLGLAFLSAPGMQGGLHARDSSARVEAAAAARVSFARTVPGGDEALFAVAVSRSLGVAVAGRRDGSVVVWDAGTWSEARRFQAHEGFCYAALPSPDGRLLATAGIDGAVKLWSTTTWTLDRPLRTSGGAVVALAFALGGKRVLAAGADGAQLFDLEGGSATLAGPCSSAAASGDLAVTGGNDGAIRVWDLPIGRELRAVPAHAGIVTALAFHPTGSLFVSGGVDRAIHAWDARTGRRLRTFAGHESPVRALAFLPGGSLVISVASDGVRLWDFASGRAVRTLSMNGVGACSVAVGLGARQIVVTGGDNRIWMWGGEGPREEMPGDSRPVGFLGVHYVDGGGALVQGVFPDSPAEKSGFRVGDVISGVDNVPVEGSEDFLNYMRRSHEGDDVHLKVKRGDQTKIIRVKLGRWKDQ